MKNIWQQFRERCENEPIARDKFTGLSLEILQYHYPTKTIETDNLITNANKDAKSKVLCFSKYFTDELSNSRKGQIRKAFNETIENYKKNKKQIFAWTLFMPITLNENQTEWFCNWKDKMFEAHQIEIHLFDAEFIVTLLKKYNLYDKWITDNSLSTNNNKNTFVENNNNEIINQENILLMKEQDITNISDNNNISENAELLIENQIVENTDEKSENVIIENADVKSETLIVENAEVKTENQIKESLKGESTFQKLKTQYKDVNTTALSLSSTEQPVFDTMFKKNKIELSRFDFNIEEIRNYSTADLVYKARHFKVNENYEKALYVYEKIMERGDYKIEVVEEIVAGKEFCEKMISYRNYITEGDLLFAKNDKIKAMLAYEAAFKIDNTRREIMKKYNYVFAEALVEQNIFAEAIAKYDEAIKAEPNDKNMRRRREFARLMSTADKAFKKKPLTLLNPVVAPYYYYKAKQIEANNTFLNQKIKEFTKKGSYIAIGLAMIILILVILSNISFIPEKIIKVPTTKIVTMYDFYMKKGNRYRNNINKEKPHYYDSAMIAYKKAIRFKPEDSIAAAYFYEMRKAKSEYITRAQELIRLDSSAYFISMRKPSEGLRLFKYLFTAHDKSTGKFGYVDENMNIIVPPIFDFNHEKMLEAGERFEDGKALVCLKVAPGDTVYFYIDKFCNMVKK